MQDITGVLVQPDGSHKILDLPPQIDAIWRTVGNWVEVIAPSRDAEHHDWRAYIDEEGRLKDLPVNHKGTKIAQESGWAGEHYLVGPMLFVGVNSYGNDMSIPKRFLEKFN